MVPKPGVVASNVTVRSRAGAARQHVVRAALLMLALPWMLWAATAVHAAQWAQTYGGTGADFATAALATPDGGYVVAGYTNSFSPGTIAAWLLKLDANGEVVWQKIYSGPYFGIYPNSVELAADGGYIVAADLWATGGEANVWVAKLDANGNLAWQKSYGGNAVDISRNAIATADGGYAIAASTGSFALGSFDVWVLKLDSAGNIVWQKAYGGYADDQAGVIRATRDGGYVIAGYAGAFPAPGRKSAWLLRIDASGNVLWHNAYAGALGDTVAQDVRPTPDGGYIVAGYRYSTGPGLTDALLLRLDAAGNIVWQKTYGGINHDAANSVLATSDGGFVVAGYTEFPALDHAWVFKVDASGDLLWQRTYAGGTDERLLSVRAAGDGGYIVAGDTRSFGAGDFDAFVLKLDDNGAIAGCPLMANSSVLPTDGTTVAGPPPAVSGGSSAVPAATVAMQGVSTAVPQRQCFFAEPVVPAVSGWNSLMLISALLALSGAFAMRRWRPGR